MQISYDAKILLMTGFIKTGTLRQMLNNVKRWYNKERI